MHKIYNFSPECIVFTLVEHVSLGSVKWNMLGEGDAHFCGNDSSAPLKSNEEVISQPWRAKSLWAQTVEACFRGSVTQFTCFFFSSSSNVWDQCQKEPFSSDDSHDYNSSSIRHGLDGWTSFRIRIAQYLHKWGAQISISFEELHLK